MDNPEYIFQILEVFSKIKTKEIPRELEEYISYVARTGDPVFQWSLVKVLMKEKLMTVLNEFMESDPVIDIPQCPNVDVFNYEVMKNNLLCRLDSFVLPPFTIQRICELLSNPRKEYNRIDKFMRAVEKNVLVVSACDLTLKRRLESDGNDSMINGILYDKVNVSLNSFTNHVFSETEEHDVDGLSVNNKLCVSETDDAQQLMNESWNEENNDNEFKIKNNNTSLTIGFDNELHFVTEKHDSNEDKINIINVPESKEAESDSVFISNESMLNEPTKQSESTTHENMNVSYEDDCLKSSLPSEASGVVIKNIIESDSVFIGHDSLLTEPPIQNMMSENININYESSSLNTELSSETHRTETEDNNESDSVFIGNDSLPIEDPTQRMMSDNINVTYENNSLNTDLPCEVQGTETEDNNESDSVIIRTLAIESSSQNIINKNINLDYENNSLNTDIPSDEVSKTGTDKSNESDSVFIEDDSSLTKPPTQNLITENINVCYSNEPSETNLSSGIPQTTIEDTNNATTELL